MSLMAEAWKSLRTCVTGVSCTAAVQAYSGPVILGMVVTNLATAEASNVVTAEWPWLLSTLVVSVGLAIVFDSNL